MVEEIKRFVKMRDVLALCGIRADSPRIPCPIHHGKNNNFTFRDNTFICFKCGAKGDIFDFVTAYFGIGFAEAVQKLSADFGIRTPKTYRENLQMLEARKAQMQKLEAQKEARKRLDSAYREAFDAWLRYDRIISNSKPGCMDEIYCEAIRNISLAEYNLEIAEMERREFMNGKSDTSNQ